MGVSISKSNAYTDMQRKVKQRAASRSKETYLTNNLKKLMEGKLPGKENEKSVKSSQLAKSIHAKHPIESLAQSSHKYPQGHSDIYDRKQLAMEEEYPEGTANNHTILSGLKRSLQMPEQYTYEDEHNHSPTEEFTKEQSSKKKTSNHPLCYTIHTKNKIEYGSNTNFTFKAFQSGKSIEIQRRGKEGNHLPSVKLIVDDPFSNPNDWRTSEDSPQVDMRFIGPKSITLSNKFAQMASHLQEKKKYQMECQVVTMKVMNGSKRSRVT